MSAIASSRKAQKDLSDHRKAKEEQRVRDLGWVMSSPQGRRFMFDLIDQKCLLFSASYTGNSETYLREGKRAVGIEITEEVQKKFPNEYVAMITEAFGLKRHETLVEAAAIKTAEGDTE